MKNLQKVCLIGSALFLQACQNAAPTESEVEAYSASSSETHLVIAAPISSSVDQKLWICQGSQVKAGTRADGYKVSIGIGAGSYRNTSNQTTTNRNRSGSNLTPVGELRISAKIPSTCSAGMTVRCMQLDGVEQGINQRTRGRGIYIHGTPSGNYRRLGDSASHGCVRMNQRDVVKVYDQVRVGTRVWINSRAVSNGNPCNFVGDRNGRAR